MKRVILSWVLVCSLPASAHHVLTELAVTRTTGRTSLRLSTEALAFRHSGGGTAELIAFEFDWAALSWLSLGARLPVGTVQRSSGITWGLADLEVRARAQLWAAAHDRLRLESVLALELPTGRTDTGLGGGHVGLSGGLSVSSAALDPVLLQLALGIAGAPGAEHHEGTGSPHGALVAMHYPLEAWATAEAVFVESWFIASALLEAHQPFAALTPFVAPGASAGVRLGAWQLRLRGQVPVAGIRRYDWRATLELAWLP